MRWKGKNLMTIGDFMRDGIDACATPEEAQEFMALYRMETPHADANIGYLSGYYGPDEMRRIQEWFGVARPVFGTSVPTPDEAFALGARMGRAETLSEGV